MLASGSWTGCSSLVLRTLRENNIAPSGGPLEPARHQAGRLRSFSQSDHSASPEASKRGLHAAGNSEKAFKLTFSGENGNVARVGRPQAALHLRGGRIPAVPARRSGAMGWPRANARAGRGHDHGLDRDVFVEFNPQPPPPSAHLVGSHAGDSCGSGHDA